MLLLGPFRCFLFQKYNTIIIYFQKYSSIVMVKAIIIVLLCLHCVVIIIRPFLLFSFLVVYRCVFYGVEVIIVVFLIIVGFFLSTLSYYY